MSFQARIRDTTQDGDGWADCIYFDFKEAFDESYKKKYYGQRKALEEWMKDILMEGK